MKISLIYGGEKIVLRRSFVELLYSVRVDELELWYCCQRNLQHIHRHAIDARSSSLLLAILISEISCIRAQSLCVGNCRRCAEVLFIDDEG